MGRIEGPLTRNASENAGYPNSVLRPVVLIENGAVTFTSPGCGEPLVLDLDDLSGQHPRFAVGVDDAEIIGTFDDLKEALDAARRALREGALQVDLELQDSEGNPLHAPGEEYPEVFALVDPDFAA